MYISNDLDEVTTIIVCPFCIERGPKYWITRYKNFSGRTRKASQPKVYFLCLICGYKTRVLDKKLIQFIQKEFENRYSGLDR
jgi:RNase P subunit RPR2